MLCLVIIWHIYDEQGFYGKAEPLYVEAKNIREKVLGKEHKDYAFSCNNLAYLYEIQGLYGKAEYLYTESKDIREKILGKQHPDYASCRCWCFSVSDTDNELVANSAPTTKRFFLPLLVF